MNCREVRFTLHFFDGTSTCAESSAPCRPPTRCEMRSAPQRYLQICLRAIHSTVRSVASRRVGSAPEASSFPLPPSPTSRIAPIPRGHARGAHARRALGGRRVALLSPLLAVADIYARDAATTFPTHPPSCLLHYTPAKIHLSGSAA